MLQEINGENKEVKHDRDDNRKTNRCFLCGTYNIIRIRTRIYTQYIVKSAKKNLTASLPVRTRNGIAPS